MRSYPSNRRPWLNRVNLNFRFLLLKGRPHFFTSVSICSLCASRKWLSGCASQARAKVPGLQWMVELEQHCNEKFNMSCIAQLLQGIGFTCATWNLADIDIINIRLFSMYMCRPSQCCVKVLVQLCIAVSTIMRRSQARFSRTSFKIATAYHPTYHPPR